MVEMKHITLSIAGLSTVAVSLGLSVGLNHSTTVDQSSNAAAAAGVDRDTKDSRDDVDGCPTSHVRFRGRNSKDEDGPHAGRVRSE